MANMMDYLDWRGDLTFQESPFNEVDNLILTEIAYVDMDGIVPDTRSNESVTVKEAADLFFQQNDEEEIMSRTAMTKVAAFVLRKMAETKRFRDARLLKYVDDISLEEESQFSVLCIQVPDGSIFVSFRGTDSSIVGWKEDFNMSFLDSIPGQRKAVEYLDQVVDYFPTKIRLGGHSKGGNLAIYAGVHCKQSVREKIVQIYSNDGPGMSHGVLESAAYQSMKGRMTFIVPESSIVGMLLQHSMDLIVIKSNVGGPMQHDAMSWEVLGPAFVRAPGLSEESLYLERTLKAWIEKMDRGEREAFVDALFGILDSAGIRTTEELAKMKWKNFSELVKAVTTVPKESKEMLLKVIHLLWLEAKKNWMSALQEKKDFKLLKE